MQTFLLQIRSHSRQQNGTEHTEKGHVPAKFTNSNKLQLTKVAVRLTEQCAVQWCLEQINTPLPHQKKKSDQPLQIRMQNEAL